MESMLKKVGKHKTNPLWLTQGLDVPLQKTTVNKVDKKKIDISDDSEDASWDWGETFY